MNCVVAEHPGREIHVVFDNLNTHKPKHDRWLASHENVHFHFTLTHASRLNQVEVWFSILSSILWQVPASPPHGTCATRSMPSLLQTVQIDAFITANSQDAHHFQWTKQVVFSQHPRAKYADGRRRQGPRRARYERLSRGERSG
jgi:hypothetical protein